MTGPEHFKQAIAILAQVEKQRAEGFELTLDGAVAAAQVHATLALAAATALNGYDNSTMPAADWTDWNATCGVPA